jgi:hypothetical protein
MELTVRANEDGDEEEKVAAAGGSIVSPPLLKGQARI